MNIFGNQFKFNVLSQRTFRAYAYFIEILHNILNELANTNGSLCGTYFNTLK